jgi:hypothetical protein
MLSNDAQQRAREALRKVDQMLAANVEAENTLEKHAFSFRDNMFAAFQFIESESMTMKELQVQIKREDKQQLRVASRGRAPFMLYMDNEAAYDSRPYAAAQDQPAETSIELAHRLFAVFAPPHVGLLRYYTVFADGAWKRTTFVPGPEGAQVRSAMVQRSSIDVLVLEAIDLLGYACTVHPTWEPLAAAAEQVTLAELHERERVKGHLTGLGAPRRHG